MQLTVIPHEPANYAVSSADELHTLFGADKEGERARCFAKGDFILANSTRAQLTTLGYTSQEGMLMDLANKHNISVRLLKYYKKVSKLFPDASVIDEYGEVIVPDLRNLDITWGTYRAAAETDDPIRWAIRADTEDLGVTALLELYHVETGKSATVTTAEQTVRQGEAVVVMVEGNRAVIEFAELPDKLRVGAAIVTITQNTVKVQEVAQGGAIAA
jgi:hypothetical protein